MSKTSYRIIYLDYANDERIYDINAYSQKQAVFVFYKLVHTVQEILSVFILG